MVESTESESRRLLGRLREAMAGDDPGQARLDKITHLIADSMGTDLTIFCSSSWLIFLVIVALLKLPVRFSGRAERDLPR